MEITRVLAQLSASGHRITKQRRVVVEAIINAKCLQNAEELYDRCRQVDSSISYPTIYRTLDMLVDAKLVRKLHFGQSRSWFEPAQQKGHHHHLVCQDCGIKVPFTACPDQLIHDEAMRNQFEVLDHHFDILGKCKDCQVGNSAGTERKSRTQM